MCFLSNCFLINCQTYFINTQRFVSKFFSKSLACILNIFEWNYYMVEGFSIFVSLSLIQTHFAATKNAKKNGLITMKIKCYNKYIIRRIIKASWTSRINDIKTIKKIDLISHLKSVPTEQHLSLQMDLSKKWQQNKLGKS